MTKAKVKNVQEDPIHESRQRDGVKESKNKKSSKCTDAKEVVQCLVDDKKSNKKKSVEVEVEVEPKPAKKPKSTKKAAETEVDNKAKKQEKSKKVDKSATPLAQPRTLLVDKNGLSLAPSRIKRLLLDVVFNRRYRVAIKELNDHKTALIEASNLKEGYLSYHGFTTETLEYFKELQSNHFTKEQTKYERKKVKELINSCSVDENKKRDVPEPLQTLVDLCKQTLLNDHNASLKQLYEKFDKNFYQEFTVVKDTHNLTGIEAFKFYKSLITRDKIRMNYNGNLRLTCFLELLLRHVVSQASTACVNSGKSTVQFSNMHNSVATDNYLFPVVSNLSAWSSAVSWQTGGRQAPATDQPTEKGKKNSKKSEDPLPVVSPSKVVPDFINVDSLNPDKKFKCNSYIVDICRYVVRLLATSQPNADLYESVKVSSEFRNLCNQVLLELVYSTGNILRIMMNTSRDHTVSANMVDALVHTYHVAFNQTQYVKSTLKELDTIALAYNKKQSEAKAAKPKRNNLAVNRATKLSAS